MATVALMGNLDVAAQNWRHWTDTSPVKHFSVQSWRASRVIHDGLPGQPQAETINEFPFFTFLHADLHAHLLATPYVLFYIAVLLHLMQRRGRGPAAFGTGRWRWPRILLTAWALGSLASINIFDFITFSCVTVGVVAAREWLRHRGWQGQVRDNVLSLLLLVLAAGMWGFWKLRRMLTEAFSPDVAPGGALILGAAAVCGVAAVIVAVVLFVRRRNSRRTSLFMARVAGTVALLLFPAFVLFGPFFVNYDAPLRGTPFEKPAEAVPLLQALAQHMKEGLPVALTDFRSGPGEFLLMWGTQMVVMASFLALAIPRLARRLPSGGGMYLWGGVGALWALLYCLTGYVVAATLTLLAILAVIGFFLSRKTPERTFVFLATGLAATILLACEHVYFRDIYGSAAQRLNTLFKFYYPCWLLIGVCVPFCIREVARAEILSKWKRRALCGASFLFIAWAMEFPIVTSLNQIARYDAAHEGKADLDGMKWMKRDHPGDYGAIQWLRENTASGETILEATGTAYSYYGRVATHTPLRTLLGWPQHEFLWRGSRFPEIKNDVKKAYQAANMEDAAPILETYGVDYVFIGELEKKDFSAEGLAKFERLAVVYRDEENDVTVYEVKRGRGEIQFSGSTGSRTR